MLWLPLESPMSARAQITLPGYHPDRSHLPNRRLRVNSNTQSIITGYRADVKLRKRAFRRSTPGLAEAKAA